MALVVNDKNKASFFQRLFSCSPAQNSAIAYEVLRLCKILFPQYREHFLGEYESLVEEANKYINENPQALSAVYSDLSSKHLLTQRYTAAFITVEAKRTISSDSQFDNYKAITLLVITYLSFRGNHEHKELCNDVRQWALGRREKSYLYLPDIEGFDFDALIKALVSLRNNAGSEKYQREIGHLVTSFQYAHLDKERATRTVTSRKFNKESQLQQTKKHTEDEYGVSVSVIEEQEFDEKDGVNASWEGEEERSGNIRSLSVVSSNDGIREEYASQAIQAKAITERIRRKSMMLSCDISTMTMFELHHLISGCIKLMKYNNQYLESARVLLLMLLTGNSFSEVRSWSAIKRDDRGIIGIKRKFQLPSHSQREQIKPMLKDVVQEYPLFLPLSLVSGIHNFKFHGTTDADLKHVLSALNKEHGTRLSLGKVSSYFVQVMMAGGQDHTLVDLITGYDAKNKPARFYTHIPYRTLFFTYKRYLGYIDRAGKTDFRSELAEVEQVFLEQNVGSPLYVDDSLLQEIFSGLITAIDTLSATQKGLYSETTHNLKVIYLQLILSLGSGYRPVDAWFGTIDDIHFLSGEYRIAEKERSVGYSGRTVLLPQIVLEHIRQYIDYCEQLVIYYAQSDIELSDRYQQAINGDMPFCFYRYQEAIQEAKPSTYMQHVDLILPLPANWARHYLRSFLFSKNVGDELIDAWMGHIHANQLPFAQFSSLTRKDLHVIRDLLEEHIVMLLSEGRK